MKHVTLLLTMAAIPAGAQEKWEFFAGPKPSPAQETCMAKLGPPHCNGGLMRELTAKYAVSQMSADDITYHNDTIGVIDGSIEIQLRDLLLSDLSKKSGAKVFHQHTHGTDHDLFVATRNAGQDSLRRYRLMPGDVIEVYLADVNMPMDDPLIFIGKKPRDLTLTRKMLALDCPNCRHVPPVPQSFWVASAATTPAVLPPGNDWGPVLRRHTQGQRYLRRIVIRNGIKVRHYIPLESGCSAFRICVHLKDSDCDKESLCSLDPAKLLSSQNPNCRHCGPQP
jgi:hypothetical protein